MNINDTNYYQKNSLEDLEPGRCTCESLEQIENAAKEFGPKNNAQCETHLKETSNSSNRNPNSKTNKKEFVKNVDFKPKKSADSEVDPVEEFLKKRGNFPISLIRQYYPEKKEGYTFDLLPLPFLQNLKSCAIREHSLKNEDNYKSWEDFLQKLPDSQHEMVLKPNDRYWRWKNYKKYVPEEHTYFRKTMSTGPKLDQLGRLPMPVEELNKFRICRDNTLIPPKFKTYLKKGDGQHLIKINKKI